MFDTLPLEASVARTHRSRPQPDHSRITAPMPDDASRPNGRAQRMYTVDYRIAKVLVEAKLAEDEARRRTPRGRGLARVFRSKPARRFTFLFHRTTPESEGGL